MAKAVRIGYWACRGFLQPIRLLLEHTGTAYEEDNPACGPPPQYSPDGWKQKKHQILEGFDFPNLPYYDDGERKITHHLAIVEYLGRKHGLAPESEDEKVNAAMLREMARDFVWCTIYYVYSEDLRDKGEAPSVEVKKEKRASYVATLTPLLKDVSRAFDKNGGGPWMLGARLTYIDFLLYEYMDHMRLLVPGILDSVPNLASFLDTFEKLPNISAYLNSERYQKFPIFTERSFIGRAEGDWKDHA